MDFGGNCYSSGITGVSSNDSMNSKSRNITTKVPRPRSSSIATTTNEGRRSRKSSSSSSFSRPIPTAEELNERSMKRRLEIFRGSAGQSLSRVQPEAGNTSATAASTTSSSSNNLVQQQEDNNNSRGQSPHSHQTSTSDDDDDDDEEILRLTQNSRHHRFGPPFGGCGLGYLPDSHDNTNDEDNNDVSSSPNNHNNYSRRSPLFTNLGRRMGFYGNLCFATPVRSNSGGEGDGVDGDIVAHLSDDNLTARPPMPLFQENNMVTSYGLRNESLSPHPQPR